MLLRELTKRLNEIAWHEQVEHEISERPGLQSPVSLESIDHELRELASAVDVELLDELEEEDGYLVWFLRLLPFVVGSERAPERARRYVENEDRRVRYWAEMISPKGENDDDSSVAHTQ